VEESGVIVAIVLGGTALLLPLAALRARRRAPLSRRLSPAESVLDHALERAAESGRSVEVAAVGALKDLPGGGMRTAESWAAAMAAQRTAAAALRHGVTTRVAAGDVVTAELVTRAAGVADATATLRAHGSDLAYAAATLAEADRLPPAALVQVGSLGALYPLAAAGYTAVPQVVLVADTVSAAYAETSGAAVLLGEQMYCFDPSLRETAAVRARESIHAVLRTALIVLVIAGVLMSAASRLGWLQLSWFGV
jgi:hypothetical protein